MVAIVEVNWSERVGWVGLSYTLLYSHYVYSILLLYVGCVELLLQIVPVLLVAILYSYGLTPERGQAGGLLWDAGSVGCRW